MSYIWIFPCRRQQNKLLWPRGNLLAQHPGFPWPTKLINDLVESVPPGNQTEPIESVPSIDLDPPGNQTEPIESVPSIDLDPSVNQTETIESVPSVDKTKTNKSDPSIDSDPSVNQTETSESVSQVNQTETNESIPSIDLDPPANQTETNESDPSIESTPPVNQTETIEQNEDMLKSWVFEEQQKTKDSNNESFIIVDKDELIFPSTKEGATTSDLIGDTSLSKLIQSEYLETFTKSQLTKKTVHQLKNLCKKYQLSSNGNKPDLIDRILQHQDSVDQRTA